MRTCFSGGNIFCVLLQVDDLFHKIDRRLRSSETEFREHNVLSAAYMLSAAFYNLAVPFFHCGIPHCLGRGNILISMLFFTVGAGRSLYLNLYAISFLSPDATVRQQK